MVLTNSQPAFSMHSAAHERTSDYACKEMLERRHIQIYTVEDLQRQVSSVRDCRTDLRNRSWQLCLLNNVCEYPGTLSGTPVSEVHLLTQTWQVSIG